MSSTTRHSDGSQTVTNNSGESTTFNSDGSVREKTSHDLAWFVGKEITVTRDGNGNEINRQDGWGGKK